LECEHALYLRMREIKRKRMRNAESAGVLYACKGAHTLFTG